MAYHIKTGNYYRIIGTAINADNGQEKAEPVVIYERDEQLYTRSISEFKQKFAGWEFDLNADIAAAKGASK